MSFRGIKDKFRSVRVSLVVIIFFLIAILISFALNFWIDVNNTKKYSDLAKNNAIFQNSLFKLYNKLLEEKILIFTNLSLTTKDKNIPAKIRNKISSVGKEIDQEYSLIIKEGINVSKEYNNQLLSDYDKYKSFKLKVSKALKKVVSIHQQNTRIKKSQKSNKSEILLSEWLPVSNDMSLSIINFSQSANFRPDRLVRTIEDLQSLRYLLMRYKEFSSRQQALFSGLIATDMPISYEELQIINNYKQLNEELLRGIKEKLKKSGINNIIEKNSSGYSLEQVLNKKNNYLNNNLILLNKLTNQASAWESFSYNLNNYLDLVDKFNLKLNADIYKVNNSIEIQSQTLYIDSRKKQFFASIVLILTIFLALISFLIITRRIIKPIENITSAMLKLSKGDKTVDVPEISRGGEIGVMASAVESFKIEAQNYSDSLEIEVAERTKELKAVNDLLTSSIDYASKIQKALLPQKHKLTEYCKDHFIYHDQRDIVGGDFYAIFENKDKMYVCVFDCAGHGVPGALLTMILGSSLQNIIKNEVESPGFLLKKLNNFFKEALSNTEGYEVSEDGLDAIVLEIKKTGNKLRFSGAGIPLLYIRQNNFEMIKGDKCGIGYSSTPINYSYKNIDVNFNKDDFIYLASDGICDQIGGKGISFGNKRLMEILLKNRKLSMPEQKNAFIKNFKDYIGDNKRRDDITLLGIKLG